MEDLIDTLPNSPGVYFITNLVSGKSYVGRAMCLKERICSHCRLLDNGTHHNFKLAEDWRNYGSDSFTVTYYTIPEIFKRDCVNAKKWVKQEETKYLPLIDAFEYNIMRG